MTNHATVVLLLQDKYRAVFNGGGKTEGEDLLIGICRTSSNLALTEFEIFASMEPNGNLTWNLPAWFLATDDVCALIKAVSSMAKELVK